MTTEANDSIKRFLEGYFASKTDARTSFKIALWSSSVGDMLIDEVIVRAIPSSFLVEGLAAHLNKRAQSHHSGRLVKMASQRYCVSVVEEYVEDPARYSFIYFLTTREESPEVTGGRSKVEYLSAVKDIEIVDSLRTFISQYRREELFTLVYLFRRVALQALDKICSGRCWGTTDDIARMVVERAREDNDRLGEVGRYSVYLHDPLDARNLCVPHVDFMMSTVHAQEGGE